MTPERRAEIETLIERSKYMGPLGITGEILRELLTELDETGEALIRFGADLGAAVRRINLMKPVIGAALRWFREPFGEEACLRFRMSVVEYEEKERSRLMEEITFDEVPEGMNAMAAMGLEGDTKHIWNSAVPAEVEGARQFFELMKSKGYAAFRLTGTDGRGEQLHAFDPEARRVIFAPPMQGG